MKGTFPMKILRNLFFVAALAGLVAVIARKLGLVGGDEDDSLGLVFDDMGEESADGGEDDASE